MFLVGGGAYYLLLAIHRFNQFHIQAQGLQFANQHVERLRHARLNGGLALHDGLINLGAAIHVVRLAGEQLLQNICSAVGFERPHFHLSEALASELRLAAQRLLSDKRVRPNAAGVNLIVYQVRELEHVNVAHGHRLLELIASHAVEQVNLARGGQARLLEQRLDFVLPRAVKDRRGEVDALLQAFGLADDLVIILLVEHVDERRVFEDLFQLFANRIFASFFVEHLGDALAQLVTGPAQMGFKNLAHVHAAGNAERIEHDLHRRAIGEIGHLFLRQNARDDALVSVATGHLIAHTELAFHGDVNLHQLDDAGRQLIALLEFFNLVFDDLAQNVNLARGHLFDLVDLLVDARVLIGILDALEIPRGNALDGLAIELGAFGQEALIGFFIVQIGFNLLATQDGFQTLEALIGENADLIRKILFQALNLSRLNGLGTFVFLLPLAGEDFHIHHRALDARRAGEGSIAHVAGLFAEDSAQQLLFRRELGLALRRDLAHQNVARLHAGADADDSTLTQVAQRRFAHVGNIARHLTGTALGVARFDLELLDMDGGVVIVLHQFFGDQGGVLKVIPRPGHEGHIHVASQRQLTL